MSSNVEKWTTDYIDGLFESPIESRLFWSVLDVAISRNIELMVWHPVESVDNSGFFVGKKPWRASGVLHVTPQQRYGRYRADFAVSFHSYSSDDPSVYVAVECDGHEWHSTREQREHDATRDRFIQAGNVPVLRFTGTEIHRSPDACAGQLIDVLASISKRRARERDSWLRMSALHQPAEGAR